MLNFERKTKAMAFQHCSCKGSFGIMVLVSAILKIMFLKIVFLKSLLFKITKAFSKTCEKIFFYQIFVIRNPNFSLNLHSFK
jgi:hypothetical protein